MLKRKFVLFLVYLLYGISLLYIKPYFTFLDNPDEYYHWRQSLLFSRSFKVDGNYPFLVHVIGGFCFLISGPLFFRFILLVFSFLTFVFFYMFVKGVFGRDVAFWSGLIYIFFFNSSFSHLFGTGTFANILGDFFSILSVYIYYRASIIKDKKNLFLLATVSFLCYFSHVLTFIVLSFLVFYSLYRKNKLFIPIVLGLLVAFLLFPSIALRIRGYSHVWKPVTKPIRVIFVKEKGFDLATIIDSLLPIWLKPINILFPLYRWYTLILFIGIYLFYKDRKNIIFLIYLLWLILLSYGLYMLNGLINIWRISLYANPLKALFTGYTLTHIMLFFMKKLNKNKYDKILYNSLIFLIVFIIIYSSISLPSLVYGIVYTHKRQIGTYDSFIWIRDHYQGSRVVSIAIKEYRFLPIIANVTYLGDYSPNYNQLVEFSKNKSVELITIFTWEYRYPLIKNNTFFKEIFNNNIIAIFLVKLHK